MSTSPLADRAHIVGRRVLLAEDDADARHVMAGVLRAMGLEVLEVADGGRMLVAIAGQYKNGHSPEEVDLVITDVCMPVVRGLDVFKGMRAAGWKTPVIIVTGFDTEEVDAVAASFDALVLTKPLDLDRFEHEVRNVLARPRHASHEKG